MRIIKLIFIILLAFLFFSCADVPETETDDEINTEEIVTDPDEETPPEVEQPDNDEPINGDPIIDDEPEIDPIEETEIVYSISGKPEKGRCLLDGNVMAQPLNDGNLDQVGSHFTGYMDENGYNIPGEFGAGYLEIFYSGVCNNELDGSTGNYSLSGIVKNSDPIKNINPLTKIRSPVARWLFDNDYGTTDECLIEAERLILNYLGMPTSEKRFTEASIEMDSSDDAVSLMYSLASLYGNTAPEQGDFMQRTATGVIENDLQLQADIIAVYDQIPVFSVINNLKASYGQFTKIPPIWSLGFHPWYFTDLIENEHTLQGSSNIESTGGCNVDLPYQTYAIPRILDSWIETTKYLATNLDGELSIWTSVFNEYDRPGIKLLDVERLDGIALDGPAALVYNGSLGDHGLTGGMEVYYVVTRADGWYLNKGCNADLLPFGRLLASNDGGQTWLGSENDSLFWRRGLSDYGMN